MVRALQESMKDLGDRLADAASAQDEARVAALLEESADGAAAVQSGQKKLWSCRNLRN